MKVYMLYKVRHNKVITKSIRLFKSDKNIIIIKDKLNSEIKDYNVFNDRGNRKEHWIISNKLIDIE